MDPSTPTLAGESLDETLAGLDDASASVGDRLGPGDVVGRFVIVSQLGIGGMGVVYAAYDPELDRKVAVKMLLSEGRPESGQSEGRARLLREAQALAKLSHPEVVGIHDVGEHAGGVWIAMEFIDGLTLGAWAKREPRSWRDVLSVMQAAARGVAAAHRAGFVHRDLKPDNIMVGSDGRVRVMDFGLTRHRDLSEVRTGPDVVEPVVHSDSRTSPLTEYGRLLGTPAYMAPEQFAGIREVTAAADQFSYCVTLWELLYGQRPFAGNTVLEIATAVLDGSIRTPVAGRGVPGWLRQVCARGLAREPASRWASMDTLLLELGRGQTRVRFRNLGVGLLATAVVVAGSVGWQRWERAQRIAACELEGATISESWNQDRRSHVRASLIATGRSHSKSTAERVLPWLDGHAAAWQLARTNACAAVRVDAVDGWDEEVLERSRWCLDERRMEFDAMVDALSQVDSPVDRAVAAAASLPSVEPCTDLGILARLAAPPPSDRQRIAEVRAQMSRAMALNATGQVSEALVLAESSLDAAVPLGWPPLTAAARLNASTALQANGSYEAAEVMREAAYFEAANGGAVEIAADAAIGLVTTVGYQLGREADGLRWAHHAEVVLGNVDDRGLRQAEYLNNLATLHDVHGDHERAKQLTEEALAILESLLGSDHPAVADALNNLGTVYGGMGSLDLAKATLLRALAITEQAFGADHPSIASSSSNLALVCMMLGEHEQAVAFATRALAITEAALGSDHPEVAYPLISLAKLHLLDGDSRAAELLAKRALAIRLGASVAQLEIAEARFTVAQTLWPSDPRGAILLASEAREEFAGVGDAGSAPLAEVDTWLENSRLGEPN